MGLVDLLWRALAVFRAGALGYVTILVATRFDGYAHPALGWLVLAGMAVWTGFASWAYALPRRRRWPLLAADLVVAVGALAASYQVVGPEDMRSGAATLPMAWVAAPVIGWAVHAGRRAGAVAALVVGGVDIAVRGRGRPARGGSVDPGPDARSRRYRHRGLRPGAGHRGRATATVTGRSRQGGGALMEPSGTVAGRLQRRAAAGAGGMA